MSIKNIILLLSICPTFVFGQGMASQKAATCKSRCGKQQCEADKALAQQCVDWCTGTVYSGQLDQCRRALASGPTPAPAPAGTPAPAPAGTPAPAPSPAPAGEVFQWTSVAASHASAASYRGFVEDKTATANASGKNLAAFSEALSAANLTLYSGTWQGQTNVTLSGKQYPVAVILAGGNCYFAYVASGTGANALPSLAKGTAVKFNLYYSKQDAGGPSSYPVTWGSDISATCTKTTAGRFQAAYQ